MWNRCSRVKLITSACCSFHPFTFVVSLCRSWRNFYTHSNGNWTMRKPWQCWNGFTPRPNQLYIKRKWTFWSILHCSIFSIHPLPHQSWLYQAFTFNIFIHKLMLVMPCSTCPRISFRYLIYFSPSNKFHKFLQITTSASPKQQHTTIGYSQPLACVRLCRKKRERIGISFKTSPISFFLTANFHWVIKYLYTSARRVSERKLFQLFFLCSGKCERYRDSTQRETG